MTQDEIMLVAALTGTTYRDLDWGTITHLRERSLSWRERRTLCKDVLSVKGIDPGVKRIALVLLHTGKTYPRKTRSQRRKEAREGTHRA